MGEKKKKGKDSGTKNIVNLKTEKERGNNLGRKITKVKTGRKYSCCLGKNMDILGEVSLKKDTYEFCWHLGVERGP